MMTKAVTTFLIQQKKKSEKLFYWIPVSLSTFIKKKKKKVLLQNSTEVLLILTRFFWLTQETTNDLPFVPPMCVCVCVCVCAQLCQIVCNPMDCSPPVSPAHGISIKSNRVGCYFLIQEIFPIHGSYPCFLHLLHRQVDSSPLSHLGSSQPSLCIFYDMGHCGLYVVLLFNPILFCLLPFELPLWNQCLITCLIYG